MPTTSVSLRIDNDLLEYLKSRAEAENRALSNMIISILINEMKRVRCKDCIHRTKAACNSVEFWECNHLRYKNTKCGVTDDWYCADGEKAVKLDE